MTEVSSESSSESYSSDDSVSGDDQHPMNISDYISWNSMEANLSKFTETFKQFSSEEKSFLLKSRCLTNNCTCNFKNYDILSARVYVGLKVLVGKWCKLKFSKGAVPDTDKIATCIFFKDFQGWYEVLNENIEVIPFWNNVSQIVQNKPKSFLLRRDSKCLYIKETSENSNSPITFENTSLKAGVILSFIQCRKYSMKKGRRVKDQYLVKCKDTRGNCFYFIPEDTVFSSPIAGCDNISGAHTFQSIIEKFHFPINVKPIFMSPPLPSLPCSDRHFLQLTKRFQLDLIVVTPLTDANRLFLLTPSLFNDHVFTIGEFMPPSVTRHPLPVDITNHVTASQSKIDIFFAKCHKYDSLSYLVKDAEDISKLSTKFEATDSEFDDIYVDVEGIYFYIRNGYFPRNSVRGQLKDVDSAPTVPVYDPLTIKYNADNEPEKDNVEKNDENEGAEEDDDEKDDSDNSTDMSSTSTDTDKTSSTAMEMCKKGRLKQAKSMPLGKSKSKIENSQFNTSNSRCHLNLTVEDMVNLSLTGMCVPTNEGGGDTRAKKVAEVPRFYQNKALLAHRFKETDMDGSSLKDTMV